MVMRKLLLNNNLIYCSGVLRGRRGRVIRTLDLKSGDPVFKSLSYYHLDLFQVVPG